MKYNQHLTTLPWADYELLDSGENMKLERYGQVVVARPETQALWARQKPELWKDAHAVFAFGEAKGSWDIRKKLPEPWHVSRGPIKFEARLTSFKHTGIFPEQEPNWVWIKDQVKALGKPNVLNLFGYTGIATLAAAHPAKTAEGGSPDDSLRESSRGAFVTHVDASKQSVEWAKKNAELSEIPATSIRWIIEDALAFAKREVRRGAKYEGIILDPPAFGRGAKKEVWKIEEDLPKLLEALKELLSDKPGSFFLLNGYAAGYAPASFAQAVESAFGPINGECGELHIKETSSLNDSRSESSGEPPAKQTVLADRVIPAGIYVRFVR